MRINGNLDHKRYWLARDQSIATPITYNQPYINRNRGFNLCTYCHKGNRVKINLKTNQKGTHMLKCSRLQACGILH